MLLWQHFCPSLIIWKHTMEKGQLTCSNVWHRLLWQHFCLTLIICLSLLSILPGVSLNKGISSFVLVLPLSLPSDHQPLSSFLHLSLHMTESILQFCICNCICRCLYLCIWLCLFLLTLSFSFDHQPVQQWLCPVSKFLHLSPQMTESALPAESGDRRRWKEKSCGNI